MLVINALIHLYPSISLWNDEIMQFQVWNFPSEKQVLAILPPIQSRSDRLPFFVLFFFCGFWVGRKHGCDGINGWNMLELMVDKMIVAKHGWRVNFRVIFVGGLPRDATEVRFCCVCFVDKMIWLGKQPTTGYTWCNNVQHGYTFYIFCVVPIFFLIWLAKLARISIILIVINATFAGDAAGRQTSPITSPSLAPLGALNITSVWSFTRNMTKSTGVAGAKWIKMAPCVFFLLGSKLNRSVRVDWLVFPSGGYGPRSIRWTWSTMPPPSRNLDHSCFPPPQLEEFCAPWDVGMGVKSTPTLFGWFLWFQ